MKVNWKKVRQYSLLYILFGIGFFAFMIVAGDDDPSNPLPFGRYGRFGRLCVHGQVSEQTRTVL